LWPWKTNRKRLPVQKGGKKAITGPKKAENACGFPSVRKTKWQNKKQKSVTREGSIRSKKRFIRERKKTKQRNSALQRGRESYGKWRLVRGAKPWIAEKRGCEGRGVTKPAPVLDSQDAENSQKQKANRSN